jgi:hypothetical protein
MATNGKTQYQKAVERAKARGFASPYAERKARAQARGYSSPRTERNARERARGVKRDYALERERANIRAQARGFRTLRDQARYNKAVRDDPELDVKKWQKREILAYFGISERKFNEIRRANKLWAKEYPMLQWTAINTYDTYLDKETSNWSERRVGYILSFYAAIVNPKTNHDALYLLGGKKTDRDEKGRPVFREGGQLKRRTNKEQFYYLVKYANLMQVDEFESRYGRQIVKDATTGKLDIT